MRTDPIEIVKRRSSGESIIMRYKVISVICIKGSSIGLTINSPNQIDRIRYDRISRPLDTNIRPPGYRRRDRNSLIRICIPIITDIRRERRCTNSLLCIDNSRREFNTMTTTQARNIPIEIRKHCYLCVSYTPDSVRSPLNINHVILRCNIIKKTDNLVTTFGHRRRITAELKDHVTQFGELSNIRHPDTIMRSRAERRAPHCPSE